VLHVVGWLEGDEADELLRVLEEAGPTPVLDLSELRAADTRGIDCLQSLARKGTELRGVQPRIALALEASRA
jgi:hypothetical protein